MKARLEEKLAKIKNKVIPLYRNVIDIQARLSYTLFRTHNRAAKATLKEATHDRKHPGTI
jgi:primosomal protein N''